MDPGAVRREAQVPRSFEQTKGNLAGAWSYCACAYGVKEQIEQTDLDLLDDFDGHPSVRKLVSTGYQILTF